MNVWKYATNKRIVFGRISCHQSLTEALAELGLAKHQALELIELGAVYCDRQRITADLSSLRPSQLRVHLQPRRFPQAYCNWSTHILGSHPLFYCIDKPAGVPVHASLDNARENLVYQLQALTSETLHPVHRLDVPTSGLVLLGRHPSAAAQLQKWIVQKKIRRRYRALVPQAIGLGLHTHFMKPDPRAPKQVSQNPPGLLCRLEILSCKARGRSFEVEIELKTGRTHQIRAQLSALGAPINGDRDYGGSRCERLMLQAFELEIECLDWGVAIASDYAMQMNANESELKILDNP